MYFMLFISNWEQTYSLDNLINGNKFINLLDTTVYGNISSTSEARSKLECMTMCKRMETCVVTVTKLDKYVKCTIYYAILIFTNTSTENVKIFIKLQGKVTITKSAENIIFSCAYHLYMFISNFNKNAPMNIILAC